MHCQADVPVEWRDAGSESREDRVWSRERSDVWKEHSDEYLVWTLESKDAAPDD